ncbi:MAG: inorganic pyrophosphatase [Deltaproteobacteria bacterium]|nr:MAG: inorganic pyrophosphatase [Deltaproteobacteria bacterium]
MNPPTLHELPERVRVLIEVPSGGFVKRDPAGRIDLISPLPSPFNYGALPDQLAPDGEGLDAIVLGSRLPRGHLGTYALHGWVQFVDAGLSDPKLMCGERPTPRDLFRLRCFFTLYAQAKSLAALVQRRPASRLLGIELR